MKKTCSTCRFSQQNTRTHPRRLECHYGPPITIDKAPYGGIWPEIEVFDLCGRFRPRPLWGRLRRFISRLIWKPQPQPSNATGAATGDQTGQ